MSTRPLLHGLDLSKSHEQITLYRIENKNYLYPPGFAFIACIFSKDLVSESGVAYVDNQPITYEIGNNPFAVDKLYRSTAVKPCMRHTHVQK